MNWFRNGEVIAILGSRRKENSVNRVCNEWTLRNYRKMLLIPCHTKTQKKRTPEKVREVIKRALGAIIVNVEERRLAKFQIQNACLRRNTVVNVSKNIHFV